MSAQSVYRVNAPHVISEVIDGEAIILNFESGCYYSLNESGMAVWQAIQDGCNQQAMLSALHQRYHDVGDEAASDLTEVLKLLELEQLIVPSDSLVVEGSSVHEGATTAYMKPGLEKFTDLQELLLLDPIHDVDESGWPRQNP